MPGLVDLPPELLENIAQHMLDCNDPAHLSALRLSCRSIEAAIRRPFRLTYFRTVVIWKPKDASIQNQKFCAISKVPDLAKSIEHIVICCADDGTAEHDARRVVQQRNAPHPSDDDLEFPGRDGDYQLVSAALISHEEALLAALLATKNVKILEFTDCHWNLSASAGNNWNNLDLPAPRPRSRSSRTGLVGFVCDISSTFNFVMSLVARAGLAPKRISMHPLDDTKLMTGLTSAIGLVTSKQALLQLKSLQLVFVHEFGSEEAVGNLIGQQLYECLDSLPFLKALSLDFQASEMSRFALDLFSKGSVLPALQHLNLSECKVSLKNFSQFVLKHSNMLVGLSLGFVYLEDGSLEDIIGFLGRLQGCSRIEYLSLIELHLNGDLIGFNLPCQARGWDLEDEGEEYIWVGVSPGEYVTLEGTNEVRDGLMMMEECIQIIHEW